LLKTVEEPADGIVIVMLADQLLPSLTTIASRCVHVQFSALDDTAISQQLMSEGVDSIHAQDAARLSHGSMERARLLATDSQLVHRYERFANVPRRIDGTGATVAAIVEDLLALIDESAAPLAARHAQEVAELDAQLAATGARKTGKKALDDRHKRELRRHRTDELRSGLAAIASVYRDELVSNSEIHRPQVYMDAVALLHDAIARLGLNVNEALLLRDTIWKLPSLNTDAALHFAH
jgi:DNA polymerase-3 subunit delta'